MIKIILITIFFIQVLLLIIKHDKNFNTFLIWSFIVNIFFYLIIELKIPSYLKAYHNFPKTITYSIILLILLTYYRVLKNFFQKSSKRIFLLALFFWGISVFVEYIGKLGLIYIPRQEFVEDVFMYIGMLIWLYLFIHISLIRLKKLQQPN